MSDGFVNMIGRLTVFVTETSMTLVEPGELLGFRQLI